MQLELRGREVAPRDHVRSKVSNLAPCARWAYGVGWQSTSGGQGRQNRGESPVLSIFEAHAGLVMK